MLRVVIVMVLVIFCENVDDKGGVWVAMEVGGKRDGVGDVRECGCG